MLSGKSLDAHHLERLLDLAELEEVDLVEWFPRGIPAIDYVGGAFRVTRGQIPSLIGKILELEDLRLHVEVFPYGIPNPEGFMVNFRTP
jgi:hypothetical protein